MLKISWTSHTINIDVLQKIGVNETTMINNLKEKQKDILCSHILRNTSWLYDTLLRTIEGRGRRSKRLDCSKQYEQINIAAERTDLHE